MIPAHSEAHNAHFVAPWHVQSVTPQRPPQERGAYLPVAADPQRGQQGGEGGEDPPGRHDRARVPQPESAVEAQRVRDGVPALQGDGRQRED